MADQSDRLDETNMDPDSSSDDPILGHGEDDTASSAGSDRSDDDDDDDDDDNDDVGDDFQTSTDVFIEIRLAGRTHELPGLYECSPSAYGMKRAKLGDSHAIWKSFSSADRAATEEPNRSAQEAKRTEKVHLRRIAGIPGVNHRFSSDFPSSDPFLWRSKAYAGVLKDQFENKPDQIGQLGAETRESYEQPSLKSDRGGLAVSLPFLVQNNWEHSPSVPVRRQSDMPRRPVASYPMPWHPVASSRLFTSADQASHIIPSPSLASSVITLNEALEPSDKPRIITLSFAPFVIVHANMAFTRLTGFSSGDVLGEGLYHCLLGGERHYPTSPSSMAADLHGRLTSVLSTPRERQLQCRVEVAPVGPETTFVAGDGAEGGDEETEDDSVCVTHYVIQLEPVGNTGGSSSGPIPVNRLSTVSPDMSPCGILG